jgi:hypothetical protein
MVFIPIGAVVRVLDNSPNSNGYLQAEWGGKRIQIFAVDLQDRGDLINARGA